MGRVGYRVLQCQSDATLPGGKRTFDRLGRYRRLSQDYEYLPETVAAFIYSLSLRPRL